MFYRTVAEGKRFFSFRNSLKRPDAPKKRLAFFFCHPNDPYSRLYVFGSRIDMALPKLTKLELQNHGSALDSRRPAPSAKIQESFPAQGRPAYTTGADHGLPVGEQESTAVREAHQQRQHFRSRNFPGCRARPG